MSTRGMLLRDFVEHALYARVGSRHVVGDGGYFNKHVVGGLRAALPFGELRDEDDYRRRAAAAGVRASAPATRHQPRRRPVSCRGCGTAERRAQRRCERGCGGRAAATG